MQPRPQRRSMFLTFATLALLFYLRHKVKSLWNKGFCKYIVGAFVIFVVAIYLLSLGYPLRSFKAPEAPKKDAKAKPILPPTKTPLYVVGSYEGGVFRAPSPTEVTMFEPILVSKSSLNCLMPVPVHHSRVFSVSRPELGFFELAERAGNTETELVCSDDKHSPLMFETEYSNLIRLKTWDEGLKLMWTDCSYRYVIDGPMNYTFSNESFPIVSDKTPIPPEHVIIGIFCHNASNSNSSVSASSPVLIDVLPFVHDKLREVTVSGKEPVVEPKSKDKNRLSVHLVILDNVSQLSFPRSFKGTYNFIMKNLSTVDLTGFSIASDEPAFGSISALLTGNSAPTKQASKTASSSGFQEPLIWEKFSSQGYYTALVQDCPKFFNSEDSFVFQKPPTDYYPNLLFPPLQEIRKPDSNYTSLCYGPRPRYQVLMDYWRSVVNLADGDQTYFMTLAACDLTEDNIREGKADEYLLEQLSWITTNNVTNKSAVFIIGTQGFKSASSELLKRPDGVFEFRMPVGFIILPDWFRLKYPLASTNLWNSRRALLTHSDIFETISDLSDLDNLSDQRISERVKEMGIKLGDSPSGISLFLPVPKDRNCQEAGVDRKVCPCQVNPFELPEDHNAVISALNFVFKKINKALRKFPQCEALTLGTFHRAILQSDKSQGTTGKDIIVQLQEGNNRLAVLHLAFSTYPDNRTLEAIVRGRGRNMWRLVEDVHVTDGFKYNKDPSQSSKDCSLPNFHEVRSNRVLDNLCYCKKITIEVKD